MNTDKIDKIIERELKEGNTLEEIYVKYDNLRIEEIEKPLHEQNETHKKEYLKIKERAASSIVIGVLFEKGYEIVRDGILSRWKRVR